jgi:hypothetical protein
VFSWAPFNTGLFAVFKAMGFAGALSYILRELFTSEAYGRVFFGQFCIPQHHSPVSTGTNVCSLKTCLKCLKYLSTPCPSYSVHSKWQSPCDLFSPVYPMLRVRDLLSYTNGSLVTNSYMVILIFVTSPFRCVLCKVKLYLSYWQHEHGRHASGVGSGAML